MEKHVDTRGDGGTPNGGWSMDGESQDGAWPYCFEIRNGCPCNGTGGTPKGNTEKHVDTRRTSREDTRKHVDIRRVEIKHKVMGLGKWCGVMWIW
jgi:hypothetical protein